MVKLGQLKAVFEFWTKISMSYKNVRKTLIVNKRFWEYF